MGFSSPRGALTYFGPSGKIRFRSRARARASSFEAYQYQSVSIKTVGEDLVAPVRHDGIRQLEIRHECGQISHFSFGAKEPRNPPRLCDLLSDLHVAFPGRMWPCSQICGFFRRKAIRISAQSSPKTPVALSEFP